MSADPHAIVKLVEFLVGEGFKVQNYSGRGMYGRRCVAMVIETPGELVRLGARVAVHPTDYWGSPRFEIRELERLSQDQYGLHTIVYWPHLEWPHGFTLHGEDEVSEDLEIEVETGETETGAEE